MLSEAIQMKLKTLLAVILSSDKITKVFHDCRHDTEAIFHQLDISVRKVEDTQVIQMYLDEIQGIKPVRMGLNQLLSNYGLSVNPMKDKFASIYQSDPRFWTQVLFFNVNFLFRDHLLMIWLRMPYPMY